MIASERAEPRQGRILVVDDEESVRFVLERALAREGYQTDSVGSAEEAKSALRETKYFLVLLDVRLPGVDGLSFLTEIKKGEGPPFVVVMTAQDTLRSAIEAMKRGAEEYLAKPFDLSRLSQVVGALAARAGAAPPVAEPVDPGNLVGASPAMVEVFKLVGRVARTPMTVLIRGESGTGKELVARAIHYNSDRSAGPFVAVNAAAIPRDLLESELYGHERGAFTGAVERRKGKFELAEGGTIFLDEIGEMPPELQSKLLRVIQEREMDRVGGQRPVPVDVRIVAATHTDLGKSVAEGRFRSDLYYRLNVVTIEIPPLRDRREDVPLLARHFLDRFAPGLKGRSVSLAPDAEAVLVAHTWPGNVRELENVIQRALLTIAGDRLTAADLVGLVHAAAGAAPAPQAPSADALEAQFDALLRARADLLTSGALTHEAALAAVERPLLKLALEKTGGNQIQAAQLLGIHRNSLRKRLRALGLGVVKTR